MKPKEKVTRLPVQHPNAPHCANCKGPLPNFNFANFTLFAGEADGVTLMAVTFHIRCKCGAPWDLRKTVKS